MMKKLLAIILSVVMLLSLAACAEDITPKEDPNADIGAPDDAEKEPEKTRILVESGSLDIASGEDVYDLVDLEHFSADEMPNYKDNMSEVFVDFTSNKKELDENMSARMLKAYENNEFLNPILETRRECFYEYDEVFFEQNQLVSFTVWSFKWLTLDAKLWSCEDENGNIQYYVELIVKNFNDMEGNGCLVRSNVTIELDKDVAITPDNLTVEVIDEREFK